MNCLTLDKLETIFKHSKRATTFKKVDQQFLKKIFDYLLENCTIIEKKYIKKINILDNKYILKEKDKIYYIVKKYYNKYIFTEILKNINEIFHKLIHEKYIHILIEEGNKIPLISYNQNHVLYACIINFDLDYIVIKFGYTYKIIRRLQELKDEFDCEVYIIGIKRVKAQEDEKDFHSNLKKLYPKLIENVVIKKHNKVECYKFTYKLWSEFLELNENINDINKLKLEIELETIKLERDKIKLEIEKLKK
jgi:hypothetical protein